jgi:hypothetical protein
MGHSSDLIRKIGKNRKIVNMVNADLTNLRYSNPNQVVRSSMSALLDTVIIVSGLYGTYGAIQTFSTPNSGSIVHRWGIYCYFCRRPDHFSVVSFSDRISRLPARIIHCGISIHSEI